MSSNHAHEGLAGAVPGMINPVLACDDNSVLLNRSRRVPWSSRTECGWASSVIPNKTLLSLSAIVPRLQTSSSNLPPTKYPISARPSVSARQLSWNASASLPVNPRAQHTSIRLSYQSRTYPSPNSPENVMSGSQLFLRSSVKPFFLALSRKLFGSGPILLTEQKGAGMFPLLASLGHRFSPTRNNLKPS